MKLRYLLVVCACTMCAFLGAVSSRTWRYASDFINIHPARIILSPYEAHRECALYAMTIQSHIDDRIANSQKMVDFNALLYALGRHNRGFRLALVNPDTHFIEAHSAVLDCNFKGHELTACTLGSGIYATDPKRKVPIRLLDDPYCVYWRHPPKEPWAFCALGHTNLLLLVDGSHLVKEGTPPDSFFDEILNDLGRKSAIEEKNSEHPIKATPLN